MSRTGTEGLNYDKDSLKMKKSMILNGDSVKQFTLTLGTKQECLLVPLFSTVCRGSTKRCEKINKNGKSRSPYLLMTPDLENLVRDSDLINRY